jgi:aminoglycoside phosphotransferase (APT) family kinase protein
MQVHVDEPIVSREVVHALVQAQFPEWAHLPLAVPAHGYPFAWSITDWIEGEAVAVAPLIDPVAAAEALGEFVAALRRVDPGDGPRPGDHNAYRGCALVARDARTRACLAELEGMLDTAPLLEAWQHALDASRAKYHPTWIHGDLAPGNLLQRDGRLVAVIDFGLLGVGDPATDLMAAWTVFDARSRLRFRATAGADDAEWSRGRGWAVSFAAIALPYYLPRRHPLAAVALETLRQVRADWRGDRQP